MRSAPSELLSERLINEAHARACLCVCVCVCERERERESTGMQILQLQQPLKAQIISEISVSIFVPQATLGMNSHSRFVSAVALAY
jgi:hypothetical protein